MNRPLIAILLAATALTAGAANAQPRDDHHDRAGRLGPGPGPQQAAPQQQQQAAPQQAPQAQTDRRGGDGRFDNNRGGNDRRGDNRRFDDRRGGNGGGAFFSYGGRDHERIRGSGFNYPGGYSYRRWGAGQILPFLFLSPQYYFNDWRTYGFGAPPAGYRWVRYGPDLLLVSRRTGRIRDVIYGAFY